MCHSVPQLPRQLELRSADCQGGWGMGGWLLLAAFGRAACCGSGPRRCRSGSLSLETATSPRRFREENCERLWTFCLAILPLGGCPPDSNTPPSLSHSPIPPRPTHPTRPACCDICEARSPHNKNTLGKCLGSNVCLNWPDESHLGPGVCATLPRNSIQRQKATSSRQRRRQWRNVSKLVGSANSGTACATK